MQKIARMPSYSTVPQGFHPLPTDHDCIIDLQEEENRNKVFIYFNRDPLEVNRKYIFQILLLNAPTINPATNFFSFETSTNPDFPNVETIAIAESVTVPGYELAQPMENTVYVKDENFGLEDH